METSSVTTYSFSNTFAWSDITFPLPGVSCLEEFDIQIDKSHGYHYSVKLRRPVPRPRPLNARRAVVGEPLQSRRVWRLGEESGDQNANQPSTQSPHRGPHI